VGDDLADFLLGDAVVERALQMTHELLFAISVAQVIRLRSRLDNCGRSQTSPNSTFSLRSISFGTT
jgi:hypothetical protein